MKTNHRVLLAASVFAVVLVGCAPAKLSVHVDLYRFTENNQQSVDVLQRARAAATAVSQMQNDVAALFTHYRVALTNRLQAQKLLVRSLPPAERRAAIEERETVFRGLLKNASDFEASFEAEFKTINRELAQVFDNVSQLQKDRVPEGASTEALLGSVAHRMDGLRAALALELSPQQPGDTSERKLSLIPLQEDLAELKRQFEKPATASTTTAEGSAAAKTGLAAATASESEMRSAMTNADRGIEGARGQPEYVNPDLLADDSDPFYQVLANPKFRPGWSTNFFVQEAAADGKVSFLIVRETPARFTMNEAKANPAVLIRTQLRSARAGLKTVATIAKAVNPALAVIPVDTSTSPDGAEPSAGGTNVTVSVAALRQRDDQSRALLVRLQRTLADFETQLNTRREAIKTAELEVATAAAAAKEATNALETAKVEHAAAEAEQNDDRENPSKKQRLEEKKAAMVQAERAEAEAAARLAAANAEATSRNAAVDAWARQSFDEGVKPVLEAYRDNLAALFPGTGRVPEAATEK